MLVLLGFKRVEVQETSLNVLEDLVLEMILHSFQRWEKTRIRVKL